MCLDPQMEGSHTEARRELHPDSTCPLGILSCRKYITLITNDVYLLNKDINNIMTTFEKTYTVKLFIDAQYKIHYVYRLN